MQNETQLEKEIKQLQILVRVNNLLLSKFILQLSETRQELGLPKRQSFFRFEILQDDVDELIKEFGKDEVIKLVSDYIKEESNNDNVIEMNKTNSNNKELTNEEKLTVLEYFNASPFGCTVYAPVNAMKNKLAGADCDFDATMTDMSELKFILINKRLEDQEKQPGFMGDCTFISYKDIVRNHLATNEDVFTDCDDIDL